MDLFEDFYFNNERGAKLKIIKKQNKILLLDYNFAYKLDHKLLYCVKNKLFLLSAIERSYILDKKGLISGRLFILLTY